MGKKYQVHEDGTRIIYGDDRERVSNAITDVIDHYRERALKQEGLWNKLLRTGARAELYAGKGDVSAVLEALNEAAAVERELLGPDADEFKRLAGMLDEEDPD